MMSLTHYHVHLFPVDPGYYYGSVSIWKIVASFVNNFEICFNKILQYYI